jgi:predicted dehydrogenase
MSAQPVRAGLVGVGAWARVLAQAASGSDKIEIVWALGRNPDRAATFSRETGIPLRESLERALDEVELDAVILAVPNELHLPFADASARAGKHVYIEKPIANELEDGLRIADLERQHGVQVVVGHCARLLAGNRLLRRMIDDGTLGVVTQVEANFSNDRGLRLTANDWRWYRAKAPGGSLSQIAIHQFDTLRFLGGDIAAVAASAARHSPVGAEIEDQWIVTVHFADGKLGTVVSSWTSPGTYSVRVTGLAAMTFYEIDQTNWSRPERLHEGATLYVQPRGAAPAGRKPVAVPPGDMFRDELDLFATAIRTSAPCELSAQNGCQALAAVYAAIRSAARGGAAVTLAEMLSEAQQAKQRRRRRG